MKISELKEFDAAEVLTDEETIRHYLALVFEEGDPQAIQVALGTVARARGMTALARDAGVKREALYRALSDTGNPEFSTIMKVLGALGLHLTIAPPDEMVMLESENPDEVTLESEALIPTSGH